jgi:hypothetical protein
MSLVEQRIEAYEQEQIEKLEKLIIAPPLYTSGPHDPTEGPLWRDDYLATPPQLRPKIEMGDDPRLPSMPAKPTLLDYFKYRCGPIEHLLQSARLAKLNGCSDKIVLACLLHDISNVCFIGSDHGYWGAQLLEPYVDEEVSWAIRYHQALRFFPDPDVGYEYPQLYVGLFGDDYVPDEYIKRAYEYARNHRWYMSARTITVNDIYAFDADIRVDLREFEDIIGRNFRQPEDGLGFDNSPSSHMWRTIIRPRKFL